MNSLKLICSKAQLVLLCVIGTAVYGQKETKTFKEVYTTTPETVLDIQTNNTDIEFETWDNDQLEIVATVTLEGASEEETKDYFSREVFDIQGNSKRVRISNKHGNAFIFDNYASALDRYHSNREPVFPSGLGMDSLFLALPSVHAPDLYFDFSDMADMPPMPAMPQYNFDYQKFKEEGETYLKQWQEEFSKGFDKDYEQKLEAWSKRMESRAKEMEKRKMEREEQREKRLKKMEKMRAEREEKRIQAMERSAAARERAEERRLRSFTRNGNRSIWISSDNDDDEANIIFFPSKGKHKNYKVKKTLKIKMPKGLKIEMDVRHGVVKLAQNTKNINANLSYSNLWANTIDGEETTIVASYSPVAVQKWKYGQLQADYADKVDLEEVTNLRLISTSSDVTIDRILGKVYVKNNYGPLKIKTIANNFSDIDVSLRNAELFCKTPNAPFSIYVNGTSSKFACPEGLTLERTKNHNTIIQKGYHMTKNKGGSIVINSKYSDVVFD